MYPVTEKYIEAMSQQIRNPVTLEGELYNVDDYEQANLRIKSNHGADIIGENLTKISSEKRYDIATFEQDWLRVDESQYFVEDYTPTYVSTLLLSSEVPDENGEYPFLYNGKPEGSIVKILGREAQPPGGGNKPITIWFHESVKRIQTLYTEKPEILEVQNGKVTIQPKENDTEIWIRIISISKPRQWARIKGIYAGDVEPLKTTDILKLDYFDQNDGVAIELPDRNIGLSIDNIDRRYKAELDYQSPYFTPRHTQIGFRFHVVSDEDIDLEWIPFPVMYLSSYKITDASVDFIFQDVIWLLNQYEHYWESSQSANADVKIAEIMKLDRNSTELYDQNGALIMTEPEKRKIGIDLSAAKNITTFCTNTPKLLTAAVMLQVLANITRNLFRTQRTGKRLEMLQISEENGRKISFSELYSYPEVSKEKKINAITLNYLDKRPYSIDLKDVVVDSAMAIPNYYAYPIVNTDPDMKYPNADNQYVKRLAAFRYVSYFKADWSSTETVTGITVEKDVSDRWEEQKTFHFSKDDGEAMLLENPLWYGGSHPERYAEYYFQELSHNIICSLSHRGFPELDAGDIIMVETETRPAVKARILENRFSISQGAMTGSTKVRLLE